MKNYMLLKYYPDRVKDILKTDGITAIWIRGGSKLRTFPLCDDMRKDLPKYYKPVPSLLLILRGYTDEVLY